MALGYNVVGKGKNPLKSTEYVQCAVFYGSPIMNELESYENVNKKKVPKELRDEIENAKFVFPYYSQQIFTSQQQAELFLPQFVRELIEKDMLPPDVLDEHQVLDPNRAQAAVVPLTVTIVEKTDE